VKIVEIADEEKVPDAGASVDGRERIYEHNWVNVQPRQWWVYM
jgi:hypothetical protein